ncbi:MAG: hypothetical protein MJ200_05160 [Mycoplasmoidaceae bacterium]|nr:hypothetical protein [Mycoplasmoidaceae bacterium]
MNATGIVTVLVIASNGHFNLDKKLTFFFVAKCSMVRAIMKTTIRTKLIITAVIKNLNKGEFTSITILPCCELNRISPRSAPQQKLNAL